MKNNALITVVSLAFFPVAGLAAEEAIDLSGNWEIHSSVGGTIPITVNCALEHQGNELIGTCTPVMENPEAATVTGTLSDGTATWGYEVIFNGNPGTVDFRAETVTAEGMLGILNLSGNIAPFAALKR